MGIKEKLNVDTIIFGNVQNPRVPQRLIDAVEWGRSFVTCLPLAW